MSLVREDIDVNIIDLTTDVLNNETIKASPCIEVKYGFPLFPHSAAPDIMHTGAREYHFFTGFKEKRNKKG
jgi:hypothetical protein